MKYYNIMSLSLNEAASSLKLIDEIWEDIMKEKQQKIRFYVLGQPLILVYTPHG